jgi:PAS domain S-box-containing protein
VSVIPANARSPAAPRWRPYAIAFGLCAAAVLLRLALNPWIGERTVLLFFFFPILLSAYLGGLRPGLFATALIGAITAYYVLPPAHSFWIAQPIDIAQWLFLVLQGVLVSVLFAELTRWRQAATRETLSRRDVTTERKVHIGFAIAVAFLGTIGVVSYLSVVRLNETSQLVTHSHMVMSNIDALVSTTSDAESAHRAYVITGEEPFAAEYTRATGRVDGLVQQLRDTVRGKPAMLARADELAEAVRARLRQSSNIVELRRTGGLEAVQRWLAQTPHRPGASAQARVREVARGMKAAEIKLLNARERDAQRSAEVTQAVIVIGSALALVFVGLALFAIRRDFAGRERAEAELNRFFDLSIDLFSIASSDGYFKRLSPAITDMLGYSVEEALRIPYLDLVHPDDRARAIDIVKLQIEGGQSVDEFVGRMRHKDGSWRTLSWRSLPRGNLMYATARDVTDAERAASELREAKEQLESRVIERTRALEAAYEAMRQSEARFRALIEYGADIIALIDLNRTILYMSPGVLNVEGYRPEELVGTDAATTTHMDDLPVLQRRVAALLANPGKPISAVWRRRHKDGRWLWLEGVATNQLDNPSVRAIVTNYRDITERMAHEARLAEQLQRLALLSRITHAIGERQDLRSIFQVVVARLEDELQVDFCSICLFDAEQNRLTVACVGTRSEPLAERIGFTQDVVVPIDENGLARCLRGELVCELDIAQAPFPFPQRLAAAGLAAVVIAPLLVESQVFGVLICARRTANSFDSADCEFLRQASEHTALATHQAQLYQALQGAYDDLRQTQQQVMQQERLRALGQMASGIAHDINNAISPVALYTQALLERETGISGRGRSQLEIIQRAVDDIAQTVARMGEFYRSREPQVHLVPVEINKLVRQVVDLTRARWSDMAQQRGAAVDVRLELGAALLPVAAVESQIRDALVNLIFNAVDAMPEGGPLTIRTSMLASEPLPSVVLEVIDAGIGMDEDTRRRCLEPFFTTKGARGTGMGLAMVYGIAQRHGVNLEIESEPGKGTIVRMIFPATREAVGAGAEAELSPPTALRILIVDDDPLLLKSLRDALEADGHSVTAASSGQAGINAFVESHAAGDPFPVVITDLGMPHVDGRKVAATIKASVPETVVLLLTGWGRRLVADGEVPSGIDEVLSKPPRLAEIRAALARQIRARAGS